VKTSSRSRGQPHRIALNLYVAFLHDVEQPDLDLARQIGQFVDGEDAAIGARQQSVVDRQFIGNSVRLNAPP
jgi:hypothetical protein